MKNLTDLSGTLGTLFFPKSALVFYQTKNSGVNFYVEHFDMDGQGRPVNAHPLTVTEAQQLARALNTANETDPYFLKPTGVLPGNVLHIDPTRNGKVVWFTKSARRELFFTDTLSIPGGIASVPAMLWVAGPRGLQVFSLDSDRRPKESAPLYHAPFFNIYTDGKVCMGTVKVSVKKARSLEEFISVWEAHFFNSYFSHLMQGHNPVKGDCVSLWQKLIANKGPFPKEVLIPCNRTLKQILP